MARAKKKTINLASPQARGLAGLWTFDEGAGLSVADSSGNGNNGIMENPDWGSSGEMDCNGTTSRVNIASSPSLDITGSEISFGGWIYPNISSAYQFIVGKDAAASQRQWALYLPNNVNFVYIALSGTSPVGAGGGDVAITSPWVVGQYNHIFFTHVLGVETLVYLNGMEVYRGAWTGNITSVASSDVHIARQGDGSYPLNGKLRDIRVYGRALQADEIRQAYVDSRAAFARRIFILNAINGISADFSATESSSDTFAADASVDVAATFAATEQASDVFSADISGSVSGQFSAIETGGDILSADADVNISANVSAVEIEADDFSAGAQAIIHADMAITESSADTFAASGRFDAVFVPGNNRILKTLNRSVAWVIARRAHEWEIKKH